jgi:hypothetical protein
MGEILLGLFGFFLVVGIYGAVTWVIVEGAWSLFEIDLEFEVVLALLFPGSIALLLAFGG